MNGIEELNQRKAAAALGGGQAKIDGLHQKGKLSARERLALLYDGGVYQELDMFVSHHCTNFGMEKQGAPGDGVVTACGKVNGRVVYAYAQDFTVLGGSLGAAHADKIVKVQDLALQNMVPIVGLMDSGGARIQEGIEALNGFGKIFYRNTIASGVIPQISAIMGPCAGGAVYSPGITDFIFMVDKTAHMFITGPDVLKTVTGESVDFEQLGGAAVHNQKSGVAHFMAKDDADCIAQVRSLLGYLPANNAMPAPRSMAGVDAALLPQLNTIVPESANKAYNMLDVIGAVVDGGKFMQVHEKFARNLIVGFAHVGGRSVGIVANQPNIQAGCIDVDASDKAARFVRFCDAFNIPLVTFVDVPGFLPGTGQEHGGIIRHGAKLLFAYSEATVPKLTVVTRKAYGGAYIAMCCQALGSDLAFAWPSAEIAVMGAEGAANIVFKKEINAAPDPAAKRQEKIEEYRQKFLGPYPAAECGYIEDIVEPAQTRAVLINALEVTATKKCELPKKKHGNIPL